MENRNIHYADYNDIEEQVDMSRFLGQIKVEEKKKNKLVEK